MSCPKEGWLKSVIIFIFGFLLGHLFQTAQIFDQIVPDSLRPALQSQEREVQVVEETKIEEESKTIRETIREIDVSKAVISRQGSDLVTASFNPEEVFGIRLFEKKTCKCTDRNIFPIDEMPEIFNSTQIAQLEKNRKHDYDKWRSNNFHQLVEPRLLISSAHNPLEFVASGYEISPFDSLNIHMKLHAAPDDKLMVTITSISGEFPSLEGMKQVQKIESKTGEMHYQIRMTNVRLINKLFDELVYSSRQYDSRPFTDYVTVLIEGDVEAYASFPIKIRIKPPPVLVYTEGGQFKDRVTFLTKTFLRYPCAYRLIDSILELYPGVTVIVADDNPKEYYQEIDAVKYPTVKQYKMPLEEGFFAGRALAVSQVKTEYFVWMDDDFWLDTDANIPYMANFLDETGFDLVFGSIGKAQIKWESYNKLVLEPAEDGFCFSRVELPNRIPVKGFEDQCHVVQIARNFFMGRTLTAGSVRHDPVFGQRGHREYFLDGVGKLRAAWCSPPETKHDHACVKGKDDFVDEYKAKRAGGGSDKEKKEFNVQIHAYWWYRSYAQCMSEP